MKHTAIPLCVLAAIALASCGDATTEPTTEPTPSSFESLQTKVLSKSCATAGCHVTGSTMATESGLVLESSVAHENLVRVLSKNVAARADSLLRVSPGHPEASFLYLKITDPSHHIGYGSRMPLGADPLTNGQIEFIRQWIAAGAPKTGVVADAALLDDTTRAAEEPFTPLAPPAPGSGFQVTTGTFDVAPRFERELFIYRALGNTDTVFVNRLETKMRSGSHHLVLYSFPSSTPSGTLPRLDEIRDLHKPDGTTNSALFDAMGYHQFVGGAMAQYQDYRFPPGVALALPPGMRVDVNSHYVNPSSTVMTGEAFANFFTVDRSEVQKLARPLFLNHQEFALPPGTRTTVRKTFTMPRTRTIFLLTSHMHKRGERFAIRIAGGPRNGELVYESTNWSHPPVVILNDNPIVLNAGEGLTSEVTYYNETTETIRFGLTSEDEMDIIFAYYY
ncbi:MAG TPA: hypothetical protein VNA88_13110 [Candidatus Kapabacteria bacterium]|nr:hypothetical protein [Candidatus Kapabacteria bacterium]